jgi:unspecific monooxygenase
MSDTASIDPFSEDFTIYPDRQIKPVRETDPVHYVESMGCWMLTRHEDVKRACSDPKLSQEPRYWEAYTPPADPDPYATLTWIAEHSPFRDEKHRTIRRMLTNTFTPRAIRRIEKQVEEVVAELSAPLKQPGVIDLVQQFTASVPNTVISRMIGIPAMGTDEQRFREQAILFLRNANPMISPEDKAECEKAAVYLLAFLRGMVAERKQQPKEDLISDLLAAAADEPELDDDHVVLVVMMLLSAGSDTAAQSANLAIRNLLTHPDQLELLKNDRSLMENAVRELLRYDAPGKFVPRFAMEDVEYGGKVIEKGKAIFMSMQGGNWDPEVFAEPEKLDITRDTSKNISFGHGPHFCVGAHLAKTEIACILNVLLDNLGPKAALLDDKVQWDLADMIFRTIESLPVNMGHD